MGWVEELKEDWRGGEPSREEEGRKKVHRLVKKGR